MIVLSMLLLMRDIYSHGDFSFSGLEFCLHRIVGFPLFRVSFLLGFQWILLEQIYRFLFARIVCIRCSSAKNELFWIG
jgi:hypothetical protein